MVLIIHTINRVSPQNVTFDPMTHLFTTYKIIYIYGLNLLITCTVASWLMVTVGIHGVISQPEEIFPSLTTQRYTPA